MRRKVLLAKRAEKRSWWRERVRHARAIDREPARVGWRSMGAACRPQRDRARHFTFTARAGYRPSGYRLVLLQAVPR